MTGFADHFSGHAREYARYRPTYPPEIYDHIFSLASSFDHAWDVATGNGQAALQLARRFAKVTASDASSDQIRNATPHDRIEYSVFPAEAPSLPDNSVDLITVAQAAHWFDHDRFYAEVRRVAKPDAVIAIWSYGINDIGEDLNPSLWKYYSDTVEPYWPPERRYIDEEYKTLPFPFLELDSPDFEMKRSMTLDEFLGYLETWSATQRYISERGENPLDVLREEFLAWSGVREVRWRFFFRAARVNE